MLCLAIPRRLRLGFAVRSRPLHDCRTNSTTAVAPGALDCSFELPPSISAPYIGAKVPTALVLAITPQRVSSGTPTMLNVSSSVRQAQVHGVSASPSIRNSIVTTSQAHD